jgi:hypothetical protein
MIILISLNEIKLWFVTFLASCSGFTIKITGPILSCPETVIMRAQRSAKVLLMDSLTFSDAYLSHQSRFRDAKLEPYTEIQFKQILLQKDLERSKKPVDLNAIDKNALNEIDTIRLMELKGLIENPYRGTDANIVHPDIYGTMTNTFIDELNGFDTLEEAGFLLKIVKKENHTTRIGLEIKNPCDNDNIILNTRKLAIGEFGGLKKTMQKRAYDEGYHKEHYCHQVMGSTNYDKVLVLSLFGIKPEIKSLYLEQLKRGIEDHEKGLKKANYQKIELKSEYMSIRNSSIKRYKKFFAQRKVFILDTKLSYFRIDTNVKAATGLYIVKTLL